MTHPIAPPIAVADGLEPEGDSPWAPLRVPIYRAFWIASIVSNLGTWIQEVGAGWLMTRLDSSPEMVSAVRVAVSLPTLLLAIVVGVMADRIDRRKLLIITQIMLFATTATLSVLTRWEVITAWGLLLLSFAMGVGTVVHILSWQSTVPLLVPRRQLSRAIALGSISFNLARSVGPALGGLLVASFGVWVAFAVNSLSFLGVLAVLVMWKPEPVDRGQLASFRQNLTEGVQFLVGNQTMRNTLTVLFLFLMPATALWALLPLVAREQLGWQAKGYGLLVTALGLGAVVAARLLHGLHRRFKLDRTIAVAMITFACGLMVIGSSRQGSLVMLATLLMGAAWMLALTTLNSCAQLTLPNSLRARGMGGYMTVMAGSMSVGSLVWGQIAGYCGLMQTQWIAAAAMLIGAALHVRFPVNAAFELHWNDSPTSKA
jgi:predicted MFS family arabinose efflux permease